MNIAQLPSEEFSALLASLRICIANDNTEEEIMKELDLSPINLSTLKKKLADVDGGEITGQAPIEIFLEYILRQKRIIKDLDAIHTRAIGANPVQGQVAIGACKAKSDILDRIIDRGQSLGVYDKKPAELKLLGDLNLDDMDLGELKDQVHKEMEEIKLIVGDNRKEYEVGESGEVIPFKPKVIEGSKKVVEGGKR